MHRGHQEILPSGQLTIGRSDTVVEEADEMFFWLELLIEADEVEKRRVEALLSEANELLAVFAPSQRTAKENRN